VEEKSFAQRGNAYLLSVQREVCVWGGGRRLADIIIIVIVITITVACLPIHKTAAPVANINSAKRWPCKNERNYLTRDKDI
jgi:hypothetical protein